MNETTEITEVQHKEQPCFEQLDSEFPGHIERNTYALKSDENGKVECPGKSVFSHGKNMLSFKDKYELGKTLGVGTYGVVKSAIHKATGEKVAIKIIDREVDKSELHSKMINNEISILKLLKHTNLIQVYDHIENEQNTILIMEYCEKGEIFDYILKEVRLQEGEACRLFQQLINAIDYLHSQNIAHRDLKLENLLLDYKLDLKVTDFGFSTIYSDDLLLTSPCGTPSYAAPEMLRGEEYHGLLSDVWSCGVILYSMLTGSLPFSESNEEMNVRKISSADFQMPSFISESASDLISNMLNVDPYERYDLDQIKEHSWFSLITPKPYRGILLKYKKIPVDSDLIKAVLKEFYHIDLTRSGSNSSERKFARNVVDNVTTNTLNDFTVIYYLILRKKMKLGYKSVSDLCSDAYISYVHSAECIRDSIKKECLEEIECLKVNALNSDESIITEELIVESNIKILEENPTSEIQSQDCNQSIDKLNDDKTSIKSNGCAFETAQHLEMIPETENSSDPPFEYHIESKTSVQFIQPTPLQEEVLSISYEDDEYKNLAYKIDQASSENASLNNFSINQPISQTQVNNNFEEKQSSNSIPEIRNESIHQFSTRSIPELKSSKVSKLEMEVNISFHSIQCDNKVTQDLEPTPENIELIEVTPISNLVVQTVNHLFRKEEQPDKPKQKKIYLNKQNLMALAKYKSKYTQTREVKKITTLEILAETEFDVKKYISTTNYSKKSKKDTSKVKTHTTKLQTSPLMGKSRCISPYKIKKQTRDKKASPFSGLMTPNIRNLILREGIDSIRPNLITWSQLCDLECLFAMPLRKILTLFEEALVHHKVAFIQFSNLRYKCSSICAICFSCDILKVEDERESNKVTSSQKELNMDKQNIQNDEVYYIRVNCHSNNQLEIFKVLLRKIISFLLINS